MAGSSRRKSTGPPGDWAIQVRLLVLPTPGVGCWRERWGFRVGEPETLCEIGVEGGVSASSDSYDVSLDDQQFLMVRLHLFAEDEARAAAVLVHNFLESRRSG